MKTEAPPAESVRDITIEGFLPRWARRTVSVPAFWLAGAALLALVPLAVPLLLVADLLRGARRVPLVRAFLFLTWFLTCEGLGIVAATAVWLPGVLAGREARLRWSFALQSVWVAALFRGARRLFSLGLEVEGLEEGRTGPLVVFIRHASVADTLLPIALLGHGHGIRLRYVMKRELLWDPCLDIVGQRLPNAFVRRDSAQKDREIAIVRSLAVGLGPKDGVLIYPEGTRATPEKRALALEKIAASGNPARLARAQALKHLLPPRPGGALALLDAAGEADVLFCGHTGFEGTTTLADLWSGANVGRTVRVKLWRIPRAVVPASPEDRLDWLDAEWAKLDAWVDESLRAS